MLPGSSHSGRQAQKGERQPDADGARSSADEERLGKKLAGNTAASGPERDAYAQFAHATRRASQQKIGGIFRRRSRARWIRRKVAATIENVRGQQCCRRSFSPFRPNRVPGGGPVEPRHDRGHLRLHLGNGDAGLRRATAFPLELSLSAICCGIRASGIQTCVVLY